MNLVGFVALQQYSDTDRQPHELFVRPEHVIAVAHRIGQWGRGESGTGACTYTRRVTLSTGATYHIVDSGALDEIFRKIAARAITS